MSFNNFFVILFLFHLGFSVELAFSTPSDLSKIREKQQNQKRNFLSIAHQFQKCSQELESLKTQFHNLQSDISNKRDICKQPRSGSDYRNCVGSLSQMVEDIKTLRNRVSDIYKGCPLFSSERLMRRLSNTITELEFGLTPLEGRDWFVSMDADTKNNIYERRKLSYCSGFISDLGDSMFSFGRRVNFNAISISPDVYLMTRSLTGLRVYEDYVSQIRKMCLEKADSEKHASYLEYVTLIREQEDRLKRWTFRAFQNHAHLDFEKSAQKICEYLNKRVINENHKSMSEELCVNPVNNNSWIYSAHYLIKEKRESSDTR